MTVAWSHYHLRLMVSTIAGGLPRNPEMIASWQASRERDTIKAAEYAEETVESLGGQLLEETEDRIGAMWVGFAQPGGPGTALCIESRQVKAMLKEAANVLRTMVPIHGKVIPLRARLAERVFVGPRWLPLTRDGAELTSPDVTSERAIHVMTRQGPRSALKRVDSCTDVDIACELTVLEDGIFTEEILLQLLSYASLNGLGADRSQGSGEFDFQLEEALGPSLAERSGRESFPAAPSGRPLRDLSKTGKARPDRS